ncbi:MAG: HAMP domain-containing sensor histidine kinase [Candidatus Dormiibacterota bacterium]
MVVLGIVLAIAGGVETNLLRQAVLASRAQSLQATFNDGRAIFVAEQRGRVKLGRPRLVHAAAALALVRVLAEEHVEAGAFNTSLVLVSTAGPPARAGGTVRTEVSIPTPPAADLVAAAQVGKDAGPVLLGSGGSSQLVMVFPLLGSLGNDLGAVELAEPAGPIQSELDSAGRVVAEGAAAVLLLALLIGLLLTAHSLGPLRRLTSAAQALGRGDLSRRSGIRPGRDEVGVLATVFDEMADNVERTVRIRQEAEQKMRQFIADASHELRTPLTAIKGYLDVLQRGGGAGPDAMAAALPVMSQEAERMRTLVMDLLTLARADEGRSLQVRPVDLGAFMEQFVAEHPSSVKLDLEQHRGLVALADPEALTAIATNLQNNAERHGGGAAIHWSTVEAEGMVGLRCADEGPGIPPVDLPQVFERFYRSGTSRSRQDGGSGLGLAIVRSLVEAQGGHVSVESTPGHGAAFTVLLPRSRAAGWSPPGTPT